MMTEDFRAFFLKRSRVRSRAAEDESRDRHGHQFKRSERRLEEKS